MCTHSCEHAASSSFVSAILVWSIAAAIFPQPGARGVATQPASQPPPPPPLPPVPARAPRADPKRRPRVDFPRHPPRFFHIRHKALRTCGRPIRSSPPRSRHGANNRIRPHNSRRAPAKRFGRTLGSFKVLIKGLCKSPNRVRFVGAAAPRLAARAARAPPCIAGPLTRRDSRAFRAARFPSVPGGLWGRGSPACGARCARAPNPPFARAKGHRHSPLDARRVMIERQTNQTCSHANVPLRGISTNARETAAK